MRIANTIFDAARKLLAEGYDPNDLLMLRHAGSDADSLRAKLGTAASLTVKETGYGPQLQPWKPFSTLPVRARNAPDDRTTISHRAPVSGPLRRRTFRRWKMTRHALPPSLSATRMRRLRERMKHGSVFVRFEMTPVAVDRLIALGRLNPESRRDPYAVTALSSNLGRRRSGNDDVGDGSLRYRGFYNRKK